MTDPLDVLMLVTCPDCGAAAGQRCHQPDLDPVMLAVLAEHDMGPEAVSSVCAARARAVLGSSN